MAWIIKNEGTAEFRGAHSCRVEFQTENTATGEIVRERKTMRVNSHSKSEKARCLREFRAELEKGARADVRNLTFGEYASEWLKEREAKARAGQLAARTVSKEANRLKTINMTFGDWRIREITRRDIKRFQLAITSADEEGHAPTVSGRPVSGTTAHGIRITLRQILQEAKRDEVIERNPCEDLKAPAIDTKEKEPLSAQEAARFRALLDAATPRPSLVAFRLCLFAGLRRGEACGLRWSDVDLEGGTITIRHSLCSETLELKEPKTEAGARTIPLDAGTVAYLRAYRKAQAEKLFSLGLPIGEACVCAKAGTAYMHPENLTRSLIRFAKKNGFEGVTPHILRHTYCTLLFAADVDPKTVQYLMGHSDIKTTLGVYAHYLKNKGMEAAHAVGRLMDSLPESNVFQLDAATEKQPMKAAS